MLDVGSGTGLLAVSFAERGHRVTGVEPASGMLDVARGRRGGNSVCWIMDKAHTFRLENRFDLITMTGRVFQVFLDDGEVSAVLANMRDHLADDGRLAFDTRNPAACEWESWVPEESFEVIDAPGIGRVEVWNELTAVSQRFVAFLTCFRFPNNARYTSTSSLRLMNQPELAGFLGAAGFDDVEWYGNWDGSPLQPDSPEFVVVAR